MKLAFIVHLRWHWQSYCRDDARLFSTEGLREHQFFSLMCSHYNKKVGAMIHRLHPCKKSCGRPWCQAHQWCRYHLIWQRQMSGVWPMQWTPTA